MRANQDLLVALADPTRAAIVERLRKGPSSVGTLAAGLPVSRPAVSQHLRVLHDAGLVTARREGTRRVYAIDPDRMRALRDYFDEFWRSALASFGESAQQRAKRQPR